MFRLVGSTVIISLLLAALVGCGGNNMNVEQSLRLAGELRDNKLYAAAVQEYNRLLESAELSDQERANVCYLAGRIYYEDLRDYANAAACYMRARAYDPQAAYMNDLSSNLVASLERLGQHVDAKRELGSMANVSDQKPMAGDVEVARLGDRPIFRSEIEKQIQSLPASLQKQILSKEAKQNFVRQYVGVELLYQAALREKYGDDPDIRKRAEQATKKLIVDKYVVDRVMPGVTVDTADVRTFYQANKDHYNSAPYDSVKAQVFMDYQQQKMEAAYSQYLAKLAADEKVQFFDENIQ